MADQSRMTVGGVPTGDMSPIMTTSTSWTDDWVEAAGIRIVDVPVVSVGAGLGSLALAHVLRTCDVPADSIAVLGPNSRPHHTYRELALRSQISGDDRLRSDAGSVMDCLWGWPSYAFREAAAAKTWRDRLAPLANVLLEPIASDYYTPRAEQVYASIDRECERLDWDAMLRPGRVRTIRPRADGGYFVLHTPTDAGDRRVAYRARYVHVAVGYPGIRLLDDLRAYRSATNDLTRVVNAYEPHDHIYESVRAAGGSVLVRGSGIVASRVIQRLLDDVESGARTSVTHLFRTYPSERRGRLGRERPVRNGFGLQGFNFPKASWGGQLKDELAEATRGERQQMLDRIGGTSTANRRAWRRQLTRAEAAGHYNQVVGESLEVRQSVPDTGVETVVETERDGQQVLRSDYIIDATGLLSDVRTNQLLADILDHCGATTNALGRIEVTDEFEVTGTRSGDGRFYASGSITLGGPYAPVDSFLGLQYAALTIATDLAAQRFCRRLDPLRSIRGWRQWRRGDAP